MAKLAFYDYHNMVAILEKTKHNTDFHQTVDFLEASHIRVETTDGETKILAKVNGRQRTVSESSIRRHLKLNDEEGISTLLDNELFENLSLMGYNILPNQRFSFQKGQFSHQWKFLIHTIIQCLCPKSTSIDEFSSNLATALVSLATNKTYNFSKMIFDGMMRNVKSKDETAFLIGDARYGEAFPTVTGLDVRQDREKISKTSAIPRVTSLGGGGGSRGGDLLVRNTVKDSDKSANKGSDSIDEMANVLGTLGAANILASRGLRSVFTTASLSVSTASTVVSPVVATTNGSFPTAAFFTTASVATPTTRVTRSSRGVVIEYSSLIYVNIPSISKKDKGKGKMTEPKQPSKEKVLEQISVQLARDLNAKFAQEDQIIREQAEIDSEIARIHAKRELEMMIAELDRRNEMVAKYSNRFKKLKIAEALGLEPTQEQQSEEPKELSEEELTKRMELVPVEEWNHTYVYQIFDDMLNKFVREDLDRLWSLVKETCSTTEVTDEKAKELWVELNRLYEPDSRDPLWALQRYMHDPLLWRLYDTCGVHHVCVPRNSKLESERLRRPIIQLDNESFKKLKTAEVSGTEPSQEPQSEEPKELSEVELKKMMDLVPVE
uniref:Synaptobrevin, longin-like domain protein n=1 Tax=Tanacetum cinerariifolium TaxID=118510 RepID=A0A6L2KBJ1_TANCI|nr:synaptobrevin, longin-like domain protein [Tanacetum cinerariifolium]